MNSNLVSECAFIVFAGKSEYTDKGCFRSFQKQMYLISTMSFYYFIEKHKKNFENK